MKATRQTTRPIIMSGDNPRLILEGRKTQTRRIMKPQPKWQNDAWLWGSLRYDNGDGVHYFHTASLSDSILDCWANACPYGVAGDRLWVRETWATEPRFDKIKPKDLLKCPIWYSSDDVWMEWEGKRIEHVPGKVRQSIFMMEWMARIPLEITKVRVERLQDINESDAIAEGILKVRWAGAYAYDHNGFKFHDAHTAYSMLWDSLHGKGAWGKNPWVWVVEFRLSQETGKGLSDSRQ